MRSASTRSSRSALLKALEARKDLKPYGRNAHLLFALQFHFGIEDPVSTASTSITDGSDDKKADLVYIDEERGCDSAQVVFTRVSFERHYAGFAESI